MNIFKHNLQKDNVAKYCYDISKILLAIVVVTPLVKEGLANYYLIFGGLFMSLIFLYVGHLIDGKEV